MCVIHPGETGFCCARGVSAESSGDNTKRTVPVVFSLSYGKLTSIALDPIEKKPLHHFHQGSVILSVGSFGCNLKCPWCQNHNISMAGEGDVQTHEVTPETLAVIAEQYVPEGNIGVAFTYNEPLINFEYVRDTSKILKEKGLKSVLVTNGYANPVYFDELLPFVDAMNIDLKGIDDDLYKQIGGDLETVTRNIRSAAGRCHLEITCLLINGVNDSLREMEELTDFVASVSSEIPLHISRFFPRNKFKDKTPTSIESMKQFEEIARRKLKHVSLGNV